MERKPAFCRPFLCKLTVLLLQKGVLYSIFMVYIVFRHNTDCGLLSERVEKDGISRIFRRSFRHQRVHRHGRMSAFGGTAAARRRGSADRRGQRGRRARAGGGEVLRVRLAGVAPDGQPRPGRHEKSRNSLRPAHSAVHSRRRRRNQRPAAGRAVLRRVVAFGRAAAGARCALHGARSAERGLQDGLRAGGKRAGGVLRGQPDRLPGADAERAHQPPERTQTAFSLSAAPGASPLAKRPRLRPCARSAPRQAGARRRGGRRA